VRVVVLGSGLAGVTTAEALAKITGHEVALVTAESRGYYSRPRLSHGLALSEADAAKIVLKRFEALPPGIRILSGVQAERIDREARALELVDGERIEYDALILATGSAARIPPALLPHRERFFTLNSLDDLVALRALRAGAARPVRWAVIGGGLIGCEVTSDLNKAGDAVTIFQREARLMELQLEESQSHALHEHFAARGVEVKYNQVLDDLPAGFDARASTR
jgi:nitric oxide reductase FlRd-NAD(+) reductase